MYMKSRVRVRLGLKLGLVLGLGIGVRVRVKITGVDPGYVKRGGRDPKGGVGC